MLERVQKIIAATGITSRRKAEQMLIEGRVTVNGRVAGRLGEKADPERDHVKVDGKLLQGPEKTVSVLLHKPRGYVTTLSDPERRPTVINLLKGIRERVVPVGRLDIQTSGLLVLTNDGELSHRLTGAAFQVPKTYHVKIRGRLDAKQRVRLERGIAIEGNPTKHKTAPGTVRLLEAENNSWYEVTLVEGRTHQVRRMFEALGHAVVKLHRVRIGCLTQRGLRPGRFRRLTDAEITRLKNWSASAFGSKTRSTSISKSTRKPAGRLRRTATRRKRRRAAG